MGREVRRVPADWKHPDGMCLLDGFSKRLADWREDKAQWDAGFREDFSRWTVGDTTKHWQLRTEREMGLTFEEWCGSEPVASDYMPEWLESERTHYQMYETTSEGSPISPVMDSPESLARWLADNKASAFGGMTQNYDAWLSVCRGKDLIGMAINVGTGEQNPI